jgi:hypothetical protein
VSLDYEEYFVAGGRDFCLLKMGGTSQRQLKPEPPKLGSILNHHSQAMKYSLAIIACICTFSLFAQTLYIPGGTGGIGPSSTSKVGIGTSAPQWALQIEETVAGTGGELIRNLSASPAAYTSFRLYNNTGSNVRSLEIDYASSAFSGPLVTGGPMGEGASISVTGAYPLVLATSNTARMTISPAGLVGIGTISPDKALTVNGSIHAKEVIVDLSIPTPDYVFEDSYKLPSIEQVKAYIMQHKHLPEIPSAKDIEANGMNVGEMNALLLKKVEELTLYMIEMKEAADKDRATIAELKNEIIALKRQ